MVDEEVGQFLNDFVLIDVIFFMIRFVWRRLSVLFFWRMISKHVVVIIIFICKNESQL